jgi:hypothetical protein
MSVVRVCMILLMIGGILACPMVCRERCHEAIPGDQHGESDPCHEHSCVCQGAVQSVHDPESVAATANAADDAIVCPAAMCADSLGGLAVENLSCDGGGLPFAHLESGRTLRLVFESLVL